MGVAGNEVSIEGRRGTGGRAGNRGMNNIGSGGTDTADCCELEASVPDL